MCSQRNLWAMLFGLAAAWSAAAQVPGVARWRGGGDGYYGLRAEQTHFWVNVQAGYVEPSAMDRILSRTPSQGLHVRLAAKNGLVSDLSLHGRVTSLGARPAAGLTFGEAGGLSYGVGLSWDFARRASATLGIDSYDFRTASGERDLRATSLGLQWRY